MTPNLFNVCLEDNWILISTSTFHLLWYFILVEVYGKNLASYSYVVWKREVF